MDHWKDATVPRGVVDTHTHLEAIAAKGVPVDELLTRLAAAAAPLIVDVSIDPRTLPERSEMAQSYPFVVHTSGVHPSLTAEADLESMVQTVERQVAGRRSGTRIVAVGETGLDWYRMYAPRETQLAAFERHLALAAREELPVIIHNRDADSDVFSAIRKASLSAGGVMHCFSSNRDAARAFLDAGMYVSFAGNLTYRSAADLQDAFDIVPADRILLETDAPYLAPVPVRGRVNHPAYLGHLYEFAAHRSGCTIETMVERVHQNARALFAV